MDTYRLSINSLLFRYTKPVIQTNIRCVSSLPLRARSRSSALPHQPKIPPSTIPYASASSVAACTAATGQEVIMRVATGVPIYEVFRRLSLLDAGIQTITLTAATCILVLFGNKIINKICNKATIIEMDKNKHVLASLFFQAVAAANQPLRVLLPWIGATFITMVISAFTQVALLRFENELHVVHLCGKRMADSLSHLSQLMQDSNEICIIVFAAWFFINFKDRIVNRIMSAAAMESSIDDDNLARIVFPLSTLINWATITAAILSSLHALGINIQPLLALGSVSTIAIGFAAQSTVTNVVSAFSLYTARPFIVGDRIQLKSMSGAVVVHGTVEKILPMSTVIKTDGGPRIYVHNKDIAGTLVVVNESKTTSSSITPAIPVLDTTITIQMKDVDKVGLIQDDATAFIKSHSELLDSGTNKCTLDSFSLYGPVLSIKATLRREASSKKSAIFTEILLGVEQIVRKHKANLAVACGVEQPPELSS